LAHSEIGESVCPRCAARVLVRLTGGQVCPRCESVEAWVRYGAGGRKLVIGHGDIAEADARRTGEDSRESVLANLARALPSALAVLLAAVGLIFLKGLLSPRDLGPLDELREDILWWSRWTAGLGFLGFGIAAAAAVRLRRGRWFRALGLLAANSFAIVAGVIACFFGCLHWYANTGTEWQFLSAPAMVTTTAVSPIAKAIMDATVVVVAPNKNGDARGAVIGAGAVIDSTAGHALIVTCSHVAMPYAAVASHRDASKAFPVWVYLADGRNIQGRVAWTAQPPLDIAVIAVDIADPPAPVDISPNARTIVPGTIVTFVPNPFRSGWMFHQGAVTKRDPHLTPVGEYSLVFTDLPVRPGDSGTGLYDATGQLVGINTWAHFAPEGPRGISLPSETMRSILVLSGIERSTGGEL